MTALTKKEVAKILGISTKTVERNSKKGILPAPSYVGERSPRWNAESIYAILGGQGQTESLSSSR